MFRANNCDIVRCVRCSFEQVVDRPSVEQLEEIYSGGYFASSKYDDDANQRRENERRLSLMSKLPLASSARVLDVGCATGDFLTAAATRFELSGFDWSPEAVAIARQRNPSIANRINSGPVEEQDLEPEFFDVIAMWDVIEHVWDPLATCRQLLAALRPGGYLILSTPDIGALTARVMGRRWPFMTPPEHLGFFSAPSLRWLIEERLGMSTVSSSTAGKWVNVGFLTYKLRRVFPGLVPQRLVERVEGSPLGRLSVYAPTGDIRYLAARKPEA